MFGIGYFKGQPTEFVVKYVRGRMVAGAPGLTFYYWRYKTEIVVVPITTTDTDFVFNEVTNDFQTVTIQGQFTHRIANPRQAAELLNFIIDPRRRTHVSEDPGRLPQRITNVIQTETRAEIEKRTLEEVLREAQQIAGLVLQRVRELAVLEPLGVELVSLHFLSAKPTPEVAKALEADYRESLLRRADEAIYARRAAAVEEERKIKENELSTDIALEQQRQQLIDLQGANTQREADYRGKALEREAQSRAKATELETAARIKGMEMEAKVYSELDAARILALAMRELAGNAERVLAALKAVESSRPAPAQTAPDLRLQSPPAKK